MPMDIIDELRARGVSLEGLSFDGDGQVAGGVPTAEQQAALNALRALGLVETADDGDVRLVRSRSATVADADGT